MSSPTAASVGHRWDPSQVSPNHPADRSPIPFRRFSTPDRPRGPLLSDYNMDSASVHSHLSSRTYTTRDQDSHDLDWNRFKAQAQSDSRTSAVKSPSSNVWNSR